MFLTHSFTTASVAALTGVYTVSRTIGPDYFDIEKILVEPSTGTGPSQVFFYNSATMADADRIWGVDPIAGDIFTPMELEVGGTPTERNYANIASYVDADGGGQLHIKILNQDTVAKTYTVTVVYRERALVTSDGYYGIGRVPAARITEQFVVPNNTFMGAVNAAASATVKVIGLNASNQVSIAPGGETTVFGGSVTISGAALSGTFSGTPTFSGLTTHSAGINLGTSQSIDSTTSRLEQIGGTSIAEWTEWTTASLIGGNHLMLFTISSQFPDVFGPKTGLRFVIEAPDSSVNAGGFTHTYIDIADSGIETTRDITGLRLFNSGKTSGNAWGIDVAVDGGAQTTAGPVAAIRGLAKDSDTRAIGLWGLTEQDSNATPLHIAVLGFAWSGATSGATNVAGYFGLQREIDAFPIISSDAALIADNAAFAADIFVARDNGTPVFTIADGGIATSAADIRVTTAGTDATSVVTVGGTQTLTSKTLTSPTVNAAALSGTLSGTPTFSGRPTFSAGFLSNSTIQITNQNPPASGNGFELLFNASTNVGKLLAFDRDLGVYRAMELSALTLALQIENATKALVNATGLVVTGNINPEADGTRDLGTQTTAQWANVWADSINGADFAMANKWRMVESELYPDYPRGWAIGHNPQWRDGVALFANRHMIGEGKPVFAVTDEFLEYRGRRITPEMLDRIIAFAA